MYLICILCLLCTNYHDAEIMQKKIMQKLCKNYAMFPDCIIMHALCKNYAHYAKIMQIMQVSKNYANYASPTLLMKFALADGRARRVLHLEKRPAGQVGISRDIPVQVF